MSVSTIIIIPTTIITAMNTTTIIIINIILALTSASDLHSCCWTALTEPVVRKASCILYLSRRAEASSNVTVDNTIDGWVEDDDNYLVLRWV